MLSLIDAIMQKEHSKPIIILMSDHGFTKYDRKLGQSYNFQNAINLYLPAQDYSKVPDTLSNVNLFRVLLNQQFKQQLPMLKDSVSFLQEH